MRHQAIYNTHPEVVAVDGDKDAYDKDSNLVTLDESKIKTAQDKLEKQYSDQAYARARKPLYPEIGVQLDDLYKQGAFSADMAAKIKKVKDDNPKG